MKVLFLCICLCCVCCGKRVGILYEGWHAWAANAINEVKEKGGPQFTVEDIINSNGKQDPTYIYDLWGVENDSHNYYWHTEPEMGFYCIYRKRPGEVGYGVPDCDNITSIVTKHAAQLSSIGISYVAMDGTNYPTFSPDGDVSELRPMEVLFEEWSQLRANNITTPQIAAWAILPSGSNMWTYYLNLYNNETYKDLVMFDPVINKKIMFSTQVHDPDVVSQIEYNGGRNDIYVQPMWALLPVSDYKNGTWSFFSQCIASDGNFHTSVVGTDCTTTLSTNSPLGTEMSASPSFMMDWASLPFQVPGKLMGLTFKKMFYNIFQNQPDNVFVSSFNEFLAMPLTAAPYNNLNTYFPMGLPTDSMRAWQYMDTYAYEFSRDIEPTTMHGDYIYQLLASCLRVYFSGASNCTDTTEECCQSSEFFTNVWSLKSAPGYTYDDYLLTTQYDEVQYLESKGWYQEICTPFGASDVFCGNMEQEQAQSGPFIVFNENIYGNMTGLYRCITPAGNHFFSTQPECEGQKTEYQIGWISNQRANETIRALYRCLDGNGAHYHSIDLICPPGGQDAGLLGYVR